MGRYCGVACLIAVPVLCGSFIGAAGQGASEGAAIEEPSILLETSALVEGVSVTARGQEVTVEGELPDAGSIRLRTNEARRATINGKPATARTEGKMLVMEWSGR